MHIEPSDIRHDPSWNARRKRRHANWLKRHLDRANPPSRQAMLEEISRIENGLPPAPPEPPQSEEEKLRRLIGKVSSERQAAEKQLSDLRRSGGGCSGCHQKTVKTVDTKRQFYADLETELKKHLPK
jgi:hypothetical protein